MRSLLAVVLALVTARVGAQAPPRIAIPAGPPPGVRAIWILQSDNKLLMFDGTQSKNWRGTVLPPEARKNPEAISISRAGHVIFAYPPDGRTALRRFWSSNVYAPELVGGAWDKRTARGGGFNVLSATPDLFFSSDGERLFWFEHREQRLTRNGDISRDARFLAWTTDLTGDNPQLVAEFALPSCKCATGA